MIRNFFILIFISFSLFANAQNSIKDSLFTKLKTVSDVEKINIYNELFLLYEFSDTVKARHYVRLALEQSILLDSKPDLINSLIYNGYFAEDHSNNIAAIDYYKKALNVAKEIDDKKGIASNYKNIGNVNLRQANYSVSIEYYQKALEISEEIEDNDLISKCLTNIGSIYLYQNNYKKAIINYEKSIKIAEVLNDKRRIANCLNNIGLACQLSDDYEKALKSFTESLVILEEINDKGGLADCYHNLGVIYVAKDSLKRDYKKAEENYRKSLHIYEEIGDKKGIALSYNSLGSLFYKQDQYESAIEISEKSLEIAKQIGAKDEIKNAYDNIAISYTKLKNYKKAYEYIELASLAKDSLNISKSIQLQAELEAKYENEKKQKEIELKNAEISKKDAIVKQKTNFQYALIIIIILIVFFFLFLYRSFRQKKKANILLNNQKLLIEEKNKDITNSIKYAKRIQESILPVDNIVQNTLNDAFVLFRPKDIVSGDFYWLEKVDNTILFAVVDCTGHGVPGAFISIIGYNGLNRAVNEFKLRKPSEILEKLNEIVNETIKQTYEDSTIRDGMDIALCSVNLDTLKLEYAGANNPLYIISNNEVVEYKASKRPIGHFVGVDFHDFVNHEIEIQKDDMIYIFSDGYADQFGGPKNKKFKYSQLKTILKEIHKETSEKQKNILNETIDKWMIDVEQIDDICILGVRV